MLALAPAVAHRLPSLVAHVGHDLPIADLLAELHTQPGLWHERTLRQDFENSPHACTKSITLRGPDRLDDVAATFHDLSPVDYPEIDRLPAARRLIGQIAAMVGAQRVGRAMLVRLPAGGWVTPHADEGAYASAFDRFHLCLVDGNARLIVGGKEHHLAAGELAWINHRQEHAALGGSGERIHLIVDFVAPSWRKLRGGPFAREWIHGLWEELIPLLREHKDEVAHYADIPLDPDFGMYETMELGGALRVYTARDDAGRLVGYSIHFVRPNLHYKSSKQAQQDVLYLAPEYRRGGLGMRLIQFADDQLRAEGCQVTMQHVKAKPGLNFGPLLERLGYELVDLIYCRRLDQ